MLMSVKGTGRSFSGRPINLTWWRKFGVLGDPKLGWRLGDASRQSSSKLIGGELPAEVLRDCAVVKFSPHMSPMPRRPKCVLGITKAGSKEDGVDIAGHYLFRREAKR